VLDAPLGATLTELIGQLSLILQAR
jgi:hypothetical protein